MNWFVKYKMRCRSQWVDYDITCGAVLSDKDKHKRNVAVRFCRLYKI